MCIICLSPVRVWECRARIIMLWSQIIYGHRTASISPKIVRFYGARTAPGRRQEESYDFLSCFRHRTVPGEVWVLLKVPRRPYGVCTHRTGTGRFLFKIYIVRFQRCPAGHRTMSDKRRELLKISLQIDRCPSGHRTMPVRAPANVLWVKLPPVRSDMFLQKNILHLHRYFTFKDINTKKYILLEQLRVINMQRTSAIDFFAVLSKCVFLYHHCQSQPQSFLF